ncbi:hypothetical protein Ga0074812_14835 [Parafrankia irregularis]|uniref:FtsK domain-containing protein n=1 Tax=Parafrankia irregularis TaxID=795642 RepID=A0A0S4QZD8_9ACTN|nr:MULTISPECIES: hypothetical protein [Parafrankia]MBE3206760.1 hypothetical protein [Parafrankia sp. CH37]CUU60835.1 hypothetical protein Ga0074812_14835 [Parafrankia irregularis]
MTATSTSTRRTRSAPTPAAILAAAAATGDADTAAAMVGAAIDADTAARAAARLEADTARAQNDPLVMRLVNGAAEATAKARAAAAAAADDPDRAAELHAVADAHQRRAVALRAAAHEALHRRRGRVLRVRAQAAPFAVIGLLWAAAAAGQMVPNGGYTLSGIYFALAVVWWWARGRTAGWADRARRYRYTVLVTTAGATWTVWACMTGPGGWRAAVLWAGGYALAAPYWNRVRIPDPPAEIPAPPVEEETPPAPVEVEDQRPLVVQLWDAWIGGPGGLFEGAELTGRQEIAHGEKYLAVLNRAAGQNRLILQARAYQVAGRMGMAQGQIDVETHPDGEHLAWVTFTLDRGGAMGSLDYPGPQACYDPDTGLIHWGRWPDGQLMPWEAMHLKRGAYSGVLFGASGSGKSRLIEQLCLTLLSTGLATVWMIDPQDGSSLPTLAKYADWAVTGTGGGRITALLEAVDMVGAIRTENNGLVGGDRGKVHAISPRMPALFVIIDECHMIFDPKIVGRENAARNAEIVDRIARAYRKAGIGVILASQYSDIKVFGGLESMRLNMINVNAVVMRLPSNIGQNIIATFSGDARKLPKGGFAYYVGDAAAGRDGFGRAFDAEPVLESYYQALPAPLQVEASVRHQLEKKFGKVYTGRHAAVEEAAAESLAARFGGFEVDPALLAEIAADDPALAARMATIAQQRQGQLWTPPAAQLLDATGAPVRTPAQRTTTTGTTLRTVWQPLIGKPRQQPTPPPAAVPAPAATRTHATADLSPHAQAVLGAIRDGAADKASVIAATGVSARHFHDVVAVLIDRGLIAKAGHGRYAPTTRPTVATH